MTGPSTPTPWRTGVGAVLVGITVAAAGAAGGATMEIGRAGFALAAALLLVMVRGLTWRRGRAAASGAEWAALGLAAWAFLCALPWPDVLARALAPFAWRSREVAGAAHDVRPSLDAGATMRAALALAGVAFTALAARAVVERGGVRALARVLCLVAIATSVSALARGRYGQHDTLLLGWRLVSPMNAWGTFANRAQAAGFVVVALSGAAGLWWCGRGLLDRMLALGTVGAAGASVVASGSRAGMIGVAVAVAVAVVAASRRRSLWIGAFAVLAAVVVGARVARFPAAVRLLPTRANEGNRLEIWSGTLQLAAVQPAVGVGLGAFRYAYPGDGRRPVDDWVGIAENDALQAIAETGVPGAMLLALGVAAALRSIRRDRREARPGGLPAATAFCGPLGMLPLTLSSSPLHAPAVAAAAACAWAVARGFARGGDGWGSDEYAPRVPEA